MKILHYSLGLPPYRAGGMTKYCIDLMYEEIKQQNDVSLLWPGRMENETAKLKIVRRRTKNQAGNYEMVNPLPVPLLGGVGEVNKFIEKKDELIFLDFFKKEKFDVIHIHTLMGLPIEMIIAANKLGITTIYTTHDYYGLCPRVSLLYKGENCTYDEKCTNCEECNKEAISVKQIKIKQGIIYRSVKQIKLINKLKKLSYVPPIIDKINDINFESHESKRIQYVEYRKYYEKLFSLLDRIHYNSSVTNNVFKKHGINNFSKIILISNGEIKDNKVIKKYSNKLRIGYLGVASQRKGFFLLTDVLNKFKNQGNSNFELHIYSNNCIGADYIVAHKPYSYCELSRVMNEIDVLILPSICYETFGFTVLEAMSYGVPVLVSEHVGAKDLVQRGITGNIFDVTEESLYNTLKPIIEDPPSVLMQMNKNIVEKCEINTMQAHTKKLLEFYTMEKGENSEDSNTNIVL